MLAPLVATAGGAVVAVWMAGFLYLTTASQVYCLSAYPTPTKHIHQMTRSQRRLIYHWTSLWRGSLRCRSGLLLCSGNENVFATRSFHRCLIRYFSPFPSLAIPLHPLIACPYQSDEATPIARNGDRATAVAVRPGTARHVRRRHQPVAAVSVARHRQPAALQLLSHGHHVSQRRAQRGVQPARSGALPGKQQQRWLQPALPAAVRCR